MSQVPYARPVVRAPLIDTRPRLELQHPATSFAQRLGWVTVLLVLVLAGPALTAGAALGQEVDGEAIRGRLVNDDDGEPVAGVEIVVTTEDGEEVGLITSDADGEYLFELPGEGRYVAQLRVDSLPKGVKLTDPDKTALTFTVLPDQQKPLLFPFGEDTRDSARPARPRRAAHHRRDSHSD